MKKTKAILALLLALSMLFGSVPVSAAGSATFEVQTVTAEAGESVDVAINVKNSPGITSTKLSVAFDDALTLTNVTYGTEITGNFVKPKNMASPVILNWANGLEDFSGDYVFATLTFQVSTEADIGFCPITVTYDPDDVYNVEETNADFAITNGGIQVECSHVSKTEVPSKSASCTASGNNLYYTCDSCGMAFKADGITQTTVDAETIPATGHSYNEADCTTPKTCGTCGATDGNALGHSFMNYISNNDATCTQDGTKTAKCDRCTETDTVADVGSAKGHDYAAATCTLPKTCKVCNATEGTALGHSYTNYISNNDATCTADGTKTAKCDRCMETDTVADVGSAKGHDYAAATCTAPKTCKVCDVVEGSALGHGYNTAWSKGEDGHWHECGTCGDKIDQAAHNFGSAGDTCLTCAYERAHVHRLSLVPAQSANCTDSGNKAYYTCSGCENWFEDASGAVLIADKTSVVLAALGHDYADATCTAPKTCKVCTATDGTALGHSYTNYISNNNATCTQDGTKTTKCDRCAETDTITDVGSAKGHDYSDATCTAPKTCTVCNATEGSTLDHSFMNYTSNNDATCTQDGTKTAKCDRCAETDTITDVGSAKGHDYADATCTAPKTCKVCNATEGSALGHGYNTAWSKGEEGHWHECSTCGDKIDQTAHDFGTVGDTCVTCAYERSHVHRLSLISAKDATCTDAGNKAYYTCSGCENWFEDASGTIVIADKTTVVINAIGHDYADATCTTPKTCKVCNATEGSALGHNYNTTWSKGEEGHWHECSTCGDKSDLAEHDFGTEGDKCTICEYERSHVHRLTPVPGADATCTENGSNAYYTCSGCEDWFEDALGTVLIADKSAVVVPAQGHDFAAATCTTVKTCKSCGFTEGALLDHSDTNSDGKCDICEKAMTPTPQPDPNNPQTGDDSNVFVWLMLMLVSIGAIAVCLVGSKKRLFR